MQNMKPLISDWRQSLNMLMCKIYFLYFQWEYFSFRISTLASKNIIVEFKTVITEFHLLISVARKIAGPMAICSLTKYADACPFF